jgi:small subunit ribosomal protein S16
MTRIRLARHGRKNCPFFKIVVINSKKKRDGEFIEDIGFYNPMIKTENIKDKIKINMERYNYWIELGAQPSEKVFYLSAKLK